MTAPTPAAFAAEREKDAETLRVLREVVAEYRRGELWSSQAMNHICAVLGDDQ